MYVSVSPHEVSKDGPVQPWGALISRDGLAACCTLAVLCLCQVWFCFLPSATGNRFYYQGSPSAMQFAALLADTLLLTVLFIALGWAGERVCGFRTGEWLRDVAFLLFLVVPANAVRGLFQLGTARLTLDYWRHAGVHRSGLPLAYWIAAAAGFLAIFFCFHRLFVRIAYRTLVLLFPLVPLMLAEGSWIMLRDMAHPAPQAHAGRQRGMPGGIRPQRVVWIVFDEMDYRLAFESPANAHLPEFNRLASRGLDALHAYPPGGRTMISVPALLAGRLVTRSTAVDDSDLRVRYEGAVGPVRWQAEQTIFDLERQRGWRTGVAGWYFPYSRVFGEDTEAWQHQGWRLGLNPNRPFAGLMTDQLRVLAEGKSQSLLGESLTLMQHKEIVREVVAEAVRKAADPALDLVFLHLPVPHTPFFYDARTGQDASPLRPVLGYFDHLDLADRVLGQIRQAMKEAGVADKTTLLISSDHWNRQADLLDGTMDHRVPFLISFPGGREGIRYSAPFNTVLSRRLVTAIICGEVRSAGEAARWIDREKGGLTESPYNRN